MRTCHDKRQLGLRETLALFVRDLPDGGCEVQCSQCGGKQGERSPPGAFVACRNCGYELQYPAWASW